jgi:hypothetical protein
MITHKIPNTSMKGTTTAVTIMENMDMKVMSNTVNTVMAAKGIVIPMASKAEKKKIPIVAIKNTGTKGTTIAATITEPTVMIMDTSKKVMSTPGISTVNTAMATKDMVMKNMTTEGMITGMEDTITVRALCR